MQILAISGSLRAHSTNTSLLRSLALLCPAGSKVTLYEELSQLPPFNPDHEADHQFNPVHRFRQALRSCDAVMISTPEYAHGIPGSLKNALDWVVGTGELSRKWVLLVNASSRAVYAQAALNEVLCAMDARRLPSLDVTVDLPRRDMAPEDIAQAPDLAPQLQRFLAMAKENISKQNAAPS